MECGGNHRATPLSDAGRSASLQRQAVRLTPPTASHEYPRETNCPHPGVRSPVPHAKAVWCSASHRSPRKEPLGVRWQTQSDTAFRCGWIIILAATSSPSHATDCPHEYLRETNCPHRSVRSPVPHAKAVWRSASRRTKERALGVRWQSPSDTAFRCGIGVHLPSESQSVSNPRHPRDCPRQTNRHHPSVRSPVSHPKRRGAPLPAALQSVGLSTFRPLTPRSSLRST